MVTLGAAFSRPAPYLEPCPSGNPPCPTRCHPTFSQDESRLTHAHEMRSMRNCRAFRATEHSRSKRTSSRVSPNHRTLEALISSWRGSCELDNRQCPEGSISPHDFEKYIEAHGTWLCRSLSSKPITLKDYLRPTQTSSDYDRNCFSSLDSV